MAKVAFKSANVQEKINNLGVFVAGAPAKCDILCSPVGNNSEYLPDRWQCSHPYIEP